MQNRTTRSFLGTLVFASLCSGCATTTTNITDEYTGGKIPRPARILVYDFAATPADMPSWSEAKASYGDATALAGAEGLAEGRKLGADVAEELVEKINDMGMVAVRAQGEPAPQTNDLAISGYFTSIDKGSAAERVVIGFGKGASEVSTHIDAYRKTGEGMERLGGGTVDSAGGKTPGLVVPALVTIATHNPVGLAVGGAAHVAGEVSGKSGAEGSAKRIADAIAERLQSQFQEQGWL